MLLDVWLFETVCGGDVRGMSERVGYGVESLGFVA